METQTSINTFPITCKVNAKGHLTIGGCDSLELVKTYGSPLYLIDKETLIYNASSYINSLKKHYPNHLILYASKAFTNTAIFKIINNLGLGIDVVSGGEIFTALSANFNKKNIYFHGNNKSEDEIKYALTNDIGTIVLDNFYELELLQKISKELNKTIEIIIRLTPGIECHTHDYIKTGHLDSKFGFDLEYLDDVLKSIKTKGDNLRLKGLHAHIGSQIFELKPYTDTIEILLEKFSYIKQKYNIELTELNVGGGIGISYIKEDDPISIDDWARVTSETIEKACKKYNLLLPKLIGEPGRSIIGSSGVTLYTVGSSKQVPNGRKYISIDGGMADNPRPITYNAKYTAVVANKMNHTDLEIVTIAGRYCETGDILIRDITLPKLSPKDIIAVSNTGAYNYSMSSNYNMVPRPACVLVSNGQSEIIIERETYSDLIAKHK